MSLNKKENDKGIIQKRQDSPVKRIPKTVLGQPEQPWTVLHLLKWKKYKSLHARKQSTGSIEALARK